MATVSPIPYRHSGRPYRHSRVSGNPPVTCRGHGIKGNTVQDSRLRGNDGRGPARLTVGGRPGMVVLRTCRVPAYAGRTVGAGREGR